MKNKKKQEISDNSDSDTDYKLHFSDLNGSPDKKYSSNNLENKIFFDQKPSGKSTSEAFDCDVPPAINSGVEEDSENESSSEKTLQATTSLTCNETSRKDQSHTIKSIFNVKDLSSDDEIYLLQCPENCSKQELCNKNINLTNCKESITCNGEDYTVELLNSEKKFITLAVAEEANIGSLVKLPFKGHIIIQKEINMVPLESENRKVEDVHKIVFPNDLKVRHPLLGAEWKSYMELANKAINKNSSTKIKFKKLKKDKTQENLEVKIKKLKRENSHSEIFVHKKKKKG